jgi:hypothetical protein
MRNVFLLPFVATALTVYLPAEPTITSQPAPDAIKTYLRLPLAFEKEGSGKGERFLARGQGYAVGLQEGQATIGIAPNHDAKGHAVSLEFTEARAVKAEPLSQLPGKINYIHGNDPRQWRMGLPSWERVRYSGIYPGIDVVYYGNQQQLEFDLVLKAGADPRSIRLKVGGGSKLAIDDLGALRIGTGGVDDLKIELPNIYQEIGGRKRHVSGRYAIVGRNEVVFHVDSYDRTRSLVIDPTIVYSTMFGGGLNGTGAYGVGVDSSGNILLAGYTYAEDFPIVNATQHTFNGINANASFFGSDGFIAKIDKNGTNLVYSTYLGGSSYDVLEGIAVDSAGSAWVAGYTESSDFPVLNAAQSVFGGNEDVVVAKLDANGALQFASYLGGSSYDVGYGISVDASGNGYVTGFTEGSFPTTAGTLSPPAGPTKAFVTKYSPAGVIVYSSLLGGNNLDVGYAIAADSSGNAYVTGYSYSTTFTGAPAGGAQAVNNGGGDAFVAKINANATGLLYFTFLGGTAYDQGKAIAVDTSGNAYIAGQTASKGLAMAGAVQTVLAGATDGFVAKLNAAGSVFSYITYLGGTRQDYLTSLALDGSGNVYLAGYTDSVNFPTASPIQATLPGNGTSLFSSADSGATWSGADSNIPGAVFGISLNPAGTSEVVITETGIYRSVDAGLSWTQQSNVSGSSNTSSLARSVTSPGTIYTATCCSSIYKSLDDGVTWNYTGGFPFQTQGILADPLTANTVYLFGYSSPYLFKSTDGGVTWNPAATGLPATQVISLVATSDGSLYAGTQGSGIYKSTNQGAAWTAVNNGLPANASANAANSLAASGTTVYFAWGTIYETTNGGASWTATQGFANAGGVAASPQNPSIVYAYTYNNTVQESTNAGATWNAPGSGLPSTASYYNSELIVDPSNSAHLFVATPVNEVSFVSKLNSSGSALTWSTYLGGLSSTYAYGVAQNGAGAVFVTGSTFFQGFPVTSSVLPAATNNAFVTEISDATAACSLTVSPGNTTVPQYGQTLTFSVVAPSGCPWTASTNESWAVITSGASGTGAGTITVQVAYNSDSRDTQSTAVLTVGAQNITITQAGGGCSFALDKSSYAAPSAGGDLSVALTTTAGCPWSITNNYRAAIRITSGGSGTGSATINLNLAPNLTGTQENFFLPVGGNQIQIVQAGLAVPPALQLVTVRPCRIMDTRGADGPLGGPFLAAGMARTIPVPTSPCGVPANAAAYSLNITVVPRKGTLGYITVWPTGQPQPVVSTLNSIDGSVIANAAIVPAGASGSIDAFATDDTELIVDINGYFVPPAASTLQFYTLQPCRVLDTRGPDGTFGGPFLPANIVRSFPIGSSSCGAPANAAAYSLNITVVPHGTLGYLSAWPAGQQQPVVSTLNSLDGTVLANAAIVPAGTGVNAGGVSFFAPNDTDLIVDINGYFTPPGVGGLNFYTVTPCRIVDTRASDGTFGGPVMDAQTTRSFPLVEGPCGLPDTAQAYSLNMTVVPQAPILGYLSTWPAGGTQPVVSTLNAYKGQIVANAAVVPAGAGAAVEVFVTHSTYVIIDTDGYFAQ